MSPEEFARRIRDLSERGIPDLLRQTFTASALSVVAKAQLNATTRPRVRSGRLRQSIKGRANINLKATTEISVGSNVVYAALQEMGGTVTPKRGRFLAIPVGPSLTGAGVQRAGPRDTPGLHFRPSRGGGGVLINTAGEVAFVLKRSVTVPATRFLRRAAVKEADELRSKLEGLSVSLELA